MKLTGIAASGGIGIGRAVCVQEECLNYSAVSYAGAESEKQRLQAAIQRFCEETAAMAEQMRATIGQKESEILTGQILMIQDPEMAEEMDRRIENGACAEAALDETCGEFAAMLSELDDEMMRQRATDIGDMKNRMLAMLANREQVDLKHLPAGTVLIAKELTPSMTVGLRADSIAAILTETGGYTSHSAILSRALGLPAVLSVPKLLEEVQTGDVLIVDGTAGTIILGPTESEILAAQQTALVQLEKKRQMQAYLNLPTRDADGNSYALYANIGEATEAAAAAAAGAEGIGLFRTEFLFMHRDAPPSEEEQYLAYRQAAEAMNGKEVIIRTLDVGGDKAIPYLHMEAEDNPFLGVRAIRYCLQNPTLYKAQLRALLRAGAAGNRVKIMLPMVTGVQELREAKQLLAQCKEELRSEGLPFDENIPVGIMVETPAAVMLADALAAECNFFSIGTNDLTQYTLAVDRGNATIAYMYQTLHPAVLRAIRQTIFAAKQAKIPVGMCGEAAADKRLIPLLMAWGLDEFSVSSSSVTETRAVISGWSRRDAEKLAQEVMRLTTAKEVIDTLQQLN